MSDRKRHRSRSPPRQSYSIPKWDRFDRSKNHNFHPEFDQRDSHPRREVNQSTFPNLQSKSSSHGFHEHKKWNRLVDNSSNGNNRDQGPESKGKQKESYKNLNDSRDKSDQGMRPSTSGISGLESGNKSAKKLKNIEKLSDAARIKLFIPFLQKFTERQNAILTIEQALMYSRLLLESKYDSSVLLSYEGHQIFTGCLYINSQFIARAAARTKKEAKHCVYKQALDILKNESIHEIVLRVDNLEGFKKEYMDSLLEDAPCEEQVEEDDCHPLPQFSAYIQPLIRTLETRGGGNNSITELEESIAVSHSPLQTECLYEEGKSPDGKSYFRARLYLNNTLIALGHGIKKKESKREAYDNAVTALLSRTVENLEAGDNVEGSKSDKSWENLNITPLPGFENISQKPKKKTKSKNPDLNLKLSVEGQFNKLKSELEGCSDKMVNISFLDTLSVKLQMTPVCIYRKTCVEGTDTMNVLCSLYLENILIAAGESTTKKGAQIEAYQNALNYLKCTPAADIVSEQPKMPDVDFADPGILEVVHKGVEKSNESNLDRMKSLDIELSSVPKSVEELVIIEQHDQSIDRERNTYNILSGSATACGILMEWNFTPVQENMCQCSVFLQKTEVARATRSSKNAAKNRACAIILSNLYKTQPVIQIDRRIPPSIIISWNDILNQAHLRAIEVKEQFNKMNWNFETMQAIEHCMCIIEEHVQSDCLDTIVVAYGSPTPVIREVKERAGKMNLKVETHMNYEKIGVAVTKKATPSELVECLKRNGYKSGRYSLLKTSERPTLDLKIEI